MKNVSLMAALIVTAALGLVGCKDSGEAFIGKWDRVEKKIANKDDVIEITRKEGVFHITRKHWAPFKGMRGDYEVERLHARAESESVLAVIGEGLFNSSASFAIENGRLFTARGDEYKRME